jgi:hypothetical protein
MTTDPPPFGELLQAMQILFGEGMEATPENLRAAAVGLASDWYRNTEAVEEHAHANGPWSDVEMLRRNARATDLCLRALEDVVTDPAQPAVEARLSQLLD